MTAPLFARTRSHSFHPLNNDGFTRDRMIGKHGIADTDDRDWEVRLLAVRDLVRLGGDSVSQIIEGLTDPNDDVRMTCACALGVLRAETAIDALERPAD